MRDELPAPMRSEREIADLIAKYYRRKIGILMQQAEHWDKENMPLAVHDRLHTADAYFQIVHQFEQMERPGSDVFSEMERELARAPIKPLGEYPPSKDMHEKYRDPRGTAFAKFHVK